VARSNLFKTAIFGKDPNWGRVLSAVGTTDAAFEPDQLNVSMNGVQICRNGSIGEDRSLVDLEPREVLVEIDLQAGEAEATIWTNDLTHDYVHENSAYSS
jgi:glutamate N-acetyltransferase/amino-acid N-acetyltransferase